MEDGTLRVKEGDADAFPSLPGLRGLGAATGGVVGLTLGIMGGPLGVLLGGAYGMLLGSLVDLGVAEEEESVLATMARAITAEALHLAVDHLDRRLGSLHEESRRSRWSTARWSASAVTLSVIR